MSAFRTWATCRGAAAVVSSRPRGVIATTVPRWSVRHRSRATRPRFCIRPRCTDAPVAGGRIADLVGDLGLAAVQLGRIDEGGRLIQVPNALVLRNLIGQPLF